MREISGDSCSRAREMLSARRTSPPITVRGSLGLPVAIDIDQSRPGDFIIAVFCHSIIA